MKKSKSKFYLNGKVSISTIKMRQCSVEFGELAHSQSSSLEYFIGNYTAGEF